MTTNTDWRERVARQIHLAFDLKDVAPQDTSIPRLVEIIQEHCPFEPGVAYLKVIPNKPGSIYDWAARAAIYLSAERLPSTHRIAAVIAHFAEPLVKALKGSRREHYHCNDSFYCCPRCKHSDHGTNDAGDIWNPDMKCICGADELNERIDKVLQGEPE